MASAAVAEEADRQVGAALVARGFAAADLSTALAHFSGQYLPSVLLLPPAGLGVLGTMSVTDLANMGIRVQLAHITKAVLLATGAALGYLAPVVQTAVAALGRGHRPGVGHLGPGRSGPCRCRDYRVTPTPPPSPGCD